jgi:2,5-diketo-D-gluconate reductase A
VSEPDPLPHHRVLNDATQLPLIGLGTWPLQGAACTGAVASAVACGYRMVDTAAKYGNEEAVGRGLRESGVPRAQLRVVTKLRGSEQGAGTTRDALQRSLDRLGLDYVDLYLIHWPLPNVNKYVESYEAMLELQSVGLVRSVGVSNFLPEHLDRLPVPPSVNQIQLSPGMARVGLRTDLARRGIAPQAYTPLGKGDLSAKVVTDLAAAHERTAAQVILRWHVQQNIVAVPKSADPVRQEKNLSVFDFSLSDADLAALTGLDRGETAAVDANAHEEF